jgi:hypothetical protein
VVLGSEGSGGIRNVVASNIVAQGTDRGIRIKSGRGRGGVIREHPLFDNWVIEDTPYPAIEVTNYYTRVPDEPVSERTPIFRNIAIRGRDRQPLPHGRQHRRDCRRCRCEGLRFSDVVANATEGLRAFNTKGLELHNVRIDAETGVPFLIRDSADLDLDGIQTRATPKAGVAVLRLDRVKGANLRNSIAWPGTGVFLSVAPGGAAAVNSIGNVMAAAGKATEEDATDYWKSIDTPDRPRTAPGR